MFTLLSDALKDFVKAFKGLQKTFYGPHKEMWKEVFSFRPKSGWEGLIRENVESALSVRVVERLGG